jgi:hypothetical protein
MKNVLFFPLLSVVIKIISHVIHSSYDFSVDFDQIQNLLYATSEPPNSKLKKYNLVLNGK